MKENRLNDQENVRKQYQTSEKLSTRISIHSKYSTNHQGFGNWILSHYRIREGMSVLEIGCGTGQAGIEYCPADIQELPFDDQAFDIVIANMMLYHVPDLSRGLREVKRVLKDDGTFYCATFGENGMMEYISSLFEKNGVRHSVNTNFTLQNGAEKLKTVFPAVRRDLYEDALEVTDVEDMVDYIFSLTGMTDLKKIPRDEIRSVLQRNMGNGILHVPKEYGMFTASAG